MKMEKTSMPIVFVCLFSLILLSLESCSCTASKPVPALYIFGDSNVDAGNNNKLKTMFKANVPPYGIDFPGGLSASGGRASNGMTYVDFFAKWLGLQLPPAVNNVDLNTVETIDGFNYASASAGILEDSRFNDNENIYLGKQVSMFNDTVEKYLTKRFKDKAELSNYLSKSIFVISIGGNDFIFNLNMKMGEKTPSPDQISQFSEKLLKLLGEYIKELYQLGARKFLINEIGAGGCAPQLYLMKKQQPGGCDLETNKEVVSYNEKLVPEIKKWESTFQGSSFVHMKMFDIANDFVVNPTHYGFTDSRHACCQLTEHNRCDANKGPCKDRSKYVYFDAAHLTEAAHKVLATKCFSEKGVCVPMNLQELAQK
ncbi:GDSL esterase/lipase [Quillaja saponaria]|uniref:GDSL esterase/lipase n=1 Tax=Quillaja saponaria TaxID=32244 RepID=A0AAD7LDK2_QUISA|nr:GDSL esterase/lipase [Quillaja saponaria]